MRINKLLPRRTAFLIMAGAHFRPGQADDLSQAYCSSDNTGSDYSSVYSIYQSNGLCHDTCNGYAFAVVQYQSCWCSNDVPSNTVGVGSCNQDCPGYPSEQCGNQSEGLYGYIALGPSPSGTAGGSSSVASSTQASSVESPSTAQSSTEEATSQESSTIQSTPSTTSTSAPSTSSPTSTSTSSSNTPIVPIVITTGLTVTASQSMITPSPVTSTHVVTVAGGVVTQTVTSTPAPYAAPSSMEEVPQRKSVSSGTIAGAVIGALVGLALLFAAGLFLYRRRRQNKRDSVGSGLNRNASVLSRAGLLSSARAADAEKDNEEGLATGQRNSLLFGPGLGDYDDTPISAPSGIYYETPKSQNQSQSSRRNSRPLVYDQRLNPAALMQNWDLNNSRNSVNTMQDQRDYSRPLGIANPDVHD